MSRRPPRGVAPGSSDEAPGDVTRAQPRRVALASRLFPPEPGAAAYRLGALVRALADRGTSVHVLTTTPPAGIMGAWDHPSTSTSRWPVLRDRGGNVRGYVQYASFDLPLLLRLLVVRRPDVVIVEPPPTTGVVVRLVCALRRIPYVYYAGDVSTTAAAGIGTPAPVVAVLKRVETLVLRGARRVLAVSDGVARDIKALAGPDVAVTVVGTGVDTQTFRPREAIDDASPAKQRLVYAGTMSEIQGAEVFVRAFALVCEDHPDAELVMYGQGALATHLQQLADTLAPGRVRFPGVVSGEVVAAAFSSSCAGLASLHPDRGYDYAYPTKMFAATACGARIIYAGPGPGRDMVARHRLGWGVDWEPIEVGAAMAQALAEPHTPDEATRLVTWTRANASQDGVARRAADAIAAALGT